MLLQESIFHILKSKWNLDYLYEEIDWDPEDYPEDPMRERHLGVIFLYELSVILRHKYLNFENNDEDDEDEGTDHYELSDEDMALMM